MSPLLLTDLWKMKQIKHKSFSTAFAIIKYMQTNVVGKLNAYQLAIK